eukprot:2198345-Amphidinium_carterae.1
MGTFGRANANKAFAFMREKISITLVAVLATSGANVTRVCNSAPSQSQKTFDATQEQSNTLPLLLEIARTL